MAQTRTSLFKSNLFIAASIVVIVFILLLATESHIGLTWDEPDYIAASESYVHWLGQLLDNPGYALSTEGIERYWTANHEHPPFDKIWSGIVWRLTRDLLPHLTAHRLGNMLLNSLLFGLLFLLVQDVYGTWVGLAASASLLVMPRFFFHSHLAALDVAAASLIVAIVLLFWKTRDRRSWWVDIALGVLWGIAVATKVNAVFVFPTLVLWALIFQRHLRLFVRFFVMGGLAVVVFFLSWPWLYHQTVDRTIEYILFLTVNHWEIGQWYMHRFFMPPPWHFPFVITIVVVPFTILLLFFVGTGRVLKKKEERPFGTLLLLNMFIPMLVIAIGQSMVYDNDRLFIAAMPFVAALAAVGLFTVAQWIGRKLTGRNRKLAIGALVAVTFAPPIISAALLFPHMLSYYSEAVGGVAGATKLGFEATYWCETYAQTVDYLNENAEAGDIVWVDPWSHNVMIYYQLHGQLRDDIHFAGPEVVPSVLDNRILTKRASYPQTDFVVFQNRLTTLRHRGLDNPMVDWLAAHTPEFEKRHGDVPLISVYRNN